MRPIAYDVTHLVTRLTAAAPSGIDRVDLLYATALARRGAGLACGIHLGMRGPHRWAPDRVIALAGRAARLWREDIDAADDPAYVRVRQWLIQPAADASGEGAARAAIRRGPGATMAVAAGQARSRIVRDRGVDVPPGAIYLAVAQYGLHLPFFFRWLVSRRDVAPVVMIHDLLPATHPEYFRPGYGQRFASMLATIARLARGVIVSSTAVADTWRAYASARGWPLPALLVEPLPVTAEPETGDPALDAIPYFVACATIEPRKNHLLLLGIWRDLVTAGVQVPRLVLVGRRGWENEQVLDMLERCRPLRHHVIEVDGLSTAGLRRLMASARACLMPSFAEGYGLPVAEALALGVPVVASDIAALRETARDCAMLRHPLDGPAWQAAILALADRDTELSRRALALARRYRPPGHDAYFAAVGDFLARV